MKVTNIHEMYDQHTLLIMRMVLTESSSCVDVGAHSGEILREMVALAPAGNHFAFEPLPHLHAALRGTPEFRTVTISDLALSDTDGQSTFIWVKNAPAYSGLKQRRYDRPDPEIQELTVKLGKLDDVIPKGQPVDLIKIDVEGGELPVLRGARRILQKHQPYVVFESGKGASDRYGTNGERLFDYLTGECGLEVNTLDGFLTGGQALSRPRLAQIFDTIERYYFVAHRVLSDAERMDIFRSYVLDVDSRLYAADRLLSRVEPAVKRFQAQLPGLAIDDWGPESTPAGTHVNVQPDGHSAIWIRASNIQYYGDLHISFGAYVMAGPATVADGLITSGVPDIVINTAGTYPVVVTDPSGRRTEIGIFRVS